MGSGLTGMCAQQANGKSEAQPPQRPSLERDGKRLLPRLDGSGKGSSTADKLGIRQTIYPLGVRHLDDAGEMNDPAPVKPWPKSLPWNSRRRSPRLNYPRRDLRDDSVRPYQ